MIKNLIILLFAWLLGMSSSLVMAKDLVVDRSIFEDPTGQLDLESVKKNKFTIKEVKIINDEEEIVGE